MKKRTPTTFAVSTDALRHVTGGNATAGAAESTADKSLKEDQKLNRPRL